MLHFFIGLGFVPFCVAATRTFLRLLVSVQPPLEAGLIPPAAWAMLGGAVAWCTIFFIFPKPLRLYVLSHELTHALWGALMGARVSKIRVKDTKGSVTLSKTNCLITLAPYFFPFYTAIVIAGYLLLSLFLAVERYQVGWLALVGFTWAFHLTFTVYALTQHQSDIHEYGALFSYTLIYLINLIGMSLWIVVVSDVTMGQWVAFAVRDIEEIWLTCFVWLKKFLARGQ